MAYDYGSCNPLFVGETHHHWWFVNFGLSEGSGISGWYSLILPSWMVTVQVIQLQLSSPGTLNWQLVGLCQHVANSINGLAHSGSIHDGAYYSMNERQWSSLVIESLILIGNTNAAVGVLTLDLESISTDWSENGQVKVPSSLPTRLVD